MFVKAQDADILDTYFYEEYIAPDMENEDLEYRKEVNRSNIIKKEWLIADAQREMEYTPPVTVIISVLGMIFVVLFSWRENMARLDKIKNEMRILIMQGFPRKKIVRCFCVCQIFAMALTILFAGVVVKLLIYDLLIGDYYLSWELLGSVLLISVLISALFSYLTAKRICSKLYSRSQQKQLPGI